MRSQNYSSGKDSLREEFCSSSTTSTLKDQNNEQEINNMCSVLNVVIDHTMESVTPMEEEEWNTKNKNKYGGDEDDINETNREESKNEKDHNTNLLVPVIRIFGPLLRDPHSQPLQSACLYIHGAFPYFLARPAVAGPDGSLYPSPTTTTHVDWDNHDEVEEIKAEIHATLEETLQSSFLDKGYDTNTEDDHSGRKKINKQRGSHCPIIRKVTVVEGRGFYTFCPGPSTVFLRIGTSSLQFLDGSLCVIAVGYCFCHFILKDSQNAQIIILKNTTIQKFDGRSNCQWNVACSCLGGFIRI